MASLRVFLSSTATDLVEHRKIADDTLLRLQQKSVVMERFGPLRDTPVAECEKQAASCDLLVCIVAHRYGYEPEPGQGSITRREVEAAHRAGKTVYAWIVDDDQPWTQAKEQDSLMRPDVLADPAKVLAVVSAVRGLQDFKGWLRQTFVTDSFASSDDLGRKIATALANVHAESAIALGLGSSPALPVPELRVVHALQPAPHFSGRADLVKTLSAWANDTASPDRLQALVTAGGTGKTAVAEQVVASLQQRWPQPGAGSVLVWSFYEKPNADAFVRECAQLFLGEAEDALGSGRLERLQRGLRDGRPHLVVLDGLERVQADAGTGRIRGELEDHTLKLFLQAIAAGLGRTRALVTSRFPLTDLRDWQRRGVVETALDDLQPEAARNVLRAWGVKGTDAQLDAVCAQVGQHALSVAVIGSYISHFENGRIESAAKLDLDAAAGDDPKAAKLARVLAFYAERLPTEERELLARLSVFPRGITLELLGTVVDAGGKVAGLLVNAGSALTRLLARLVDRGLVFRYVATDGTYTWTAHPFVRDRFARLLDCAPEAIFEAVAAGLGRGLELRPSDKPKDVAMLDRYEQLIETVRLAGRTREAFDLYWHGLGSHKHLSEIGEYARGYRVLRGFLPKAGDMKIFAGLSPRDESIGLNDLCLFAWSLGRLQEAIEIRKADDARSQVVGDLNEACRGLLTTIEVNFDSGYLGESLAAAHAALATVNDELFTADSKDEDLKALSLVGRASALHRLGDINGSRVDFTAANTLGACQEFCVRGIT